MRSCSRIGIKLNGDIFLTAAMAKIEQSVAIDDTESSEAVGGACLEARSLRKVYGSGPDAITVLDGIDLAA